MPRLAEIIEHNGCLAQFQGEFIQRDRPVAIHRIAVSNWGVDDYNRQFIGQVPYSPTPNWSGEVRHANGWAYINVSSWPVIEVEHEIKRPRDGKTYGWAWCAPEWVKAYFPRCARCGKVHGPKFDYCYQCDDCHKSKHCPAA